jgi:hypothetical protein
MPTGKIEAADDHLRRMVGSKPVLGLAELVWNAVDANATEVAITLKRTSLDAVDEVVVTDNGHGFGAEDIEDMFGEVGGSWKHLAADRKTRDGKRILHGEKGEGRWKAFSIGERVVWDSVTAGAGPEGNRAVRLSMSDQRLDEYSWTGPVDTTKTVGTTVTVIAGGKRPTVLLSDKARQDLTAVLALYLTQYPDVRITYDGSPLSVSEFIAEHTEIEVDFPNEFGPLMLVVIEWNADVDRALFLCDESGATLHEANAGIHARGFVFTAYIRWAGFRVHETLLPLAEMDNDQIGPALTAGREALRAHFRDKRAEDTKSIVEAWREEDVYPFAEDPSDPLEMAEQALFNFVAVSASDAVNRIDDQQAKALSLQTMRVAVSRDPSSVEYILQEVLKLPEAKVDEFRMLLEQTSLTALVDAMRMVTGRLEFIAGLEVLLFDPQHAPHVLERAHLHTMVENEPWLFGEEFSTHVSDRSLTALLKAHLNLVGRDDLTSGAVTDVDGRTRRIDFLFGRALELNTARREHLVVEIKRPTVVIDRTEMDQIEDYARAVVADNRFDVQTVTWDFVLVGTGLSDLAKSRSNQPNRERGLFLELGPNVRIWVRTWADILNGCKHRLKFVRDKLEYDPDADQAVAYLRDRYPDYVPDPFVEAVQPEARTDSQLDA